MWASQVMLVVKIPPTIAGDIRNMGLNPGSEGSAGVGHSKPLQHSCHSSINRGAWRATDHRVAESDMTEQLSMHTYS